jgi:hypothetical protein
MSIIKDREREEERHGDGSRGEDATTNGGDEKGGGEDGGGGDWTGKWDVLKYGGQGER